MDGLTDSSINAHADRLRSTQRSPFMELAFIETLRHRIPPHPQLRLGIGDDAAILAHAAGSDCVLTTDLLAEGTHYVRGETSLANIGRKALAVNLSDLAAMAARPVAALVSLLLPRACALETAVGLYDGILPLAADFSVAIAKVHSIGSTAHFVVTTGGRRLILRGTHSIGTGNLRGIERNFILPGLQLNGTKSLDGNRTLPAYTSDHSGNLLRANEKEVNQSA